MLLVSASTLSLARSGMMGQGWPNFAKSLQNDVPSDIALLTSNPDTYAQVRYYAEQHQLNPPRRVLMLPLPPQKGHVPLLAGVRATDRLRHDDLQQMKGSNVWVVHFDYEEIEPSLKIESSRAFGNTEYDRGLALSRCIIVDQESKD